MTNVLEFEAALAVVREHAAGLVAVAGVETVGLLAARGRVLAEEIRADRDQPPFDRATRDGFAVRAGEFGLGVPVRVVGMVKAGEQWLGKVMEAGEAIEIMTGAPVPEGADAVVMVEHVVRDGETVKAEAGRTWRVGESIVPRGREAKAGDVVVAAGTVMGAAEIAMGSACGCVSVVVKRRVRVAIAATGDELVELEETPGEIQIRNSNSYGLAAMVEAAGGEAVRLPITADERGAVASTLRRALECDLIVLSGGVSMGEYDLVEEMLTVAGAEFFFTGVKMQPGKPVVFGRMGEKLFFGLPGNPISTQVTFHCFVEPVLRALGGAGFTGPRFGLARMSGAGERKAGLTRLLPGRLDGTDVSVVGWQGSGDLAANARANCYVELLPGDGEVEAGEIVRVLWR
ncbi:molybdopterin molybdotransferase MoeA [Granulicella tundricola]|uniref:Molybdopterin molybdenumtransferase n=1 Tax=Granulicella tundricola (strain ATCC BAA-1859 / DSM 23138 / MP5ACTX9) TaxID=1198114 RepID=E8X135_GRATM|nr:gephyrin-like molybdotransferase Glp [Granulicella tundricola]ADW67901.1 molybdenum cofactor synthesis domain protein [Granulicella tundricola MP5ACTX9]